MPLEAHWVAKRNNRGSLVKSESIKDESHYIQSYLLQLWFFPFCCKSRKHLFWCSRCIHHQNRRKCSHLSFYHVLNILVMVAVKQWRPQPPSYQIQHSTRLFGLNSKQHFTSQRRYHVLYYNWPSSKHCHIDLFTGFIIWFWWALRVMLQ